MVQAVAAGREAAGLIESALKIGKPAAREIGTERDFSEPSFVATARTSIPEASVAERVKSLEIEDIRGLSLSEIEAEARRCFNCGCLAVGPSDIGVALVALDATIVTTEEEIDGREFFQDQRNRCNCARRRMS